MVKFSACGFVTQDNLARAASVSLTTGACRYLLHLATGLQECVHLACKFISITDGQVFFRFAGHYINLDDYREKLVSIHQSVRVCQIRIS